MKCVFVIASCLLAVASAKPGYLNALPYAAPYATPYTTAYAAPLAYAAPVAPIATAVSSQYHAQDELGQYSYGYSGGPSAKQETRTADGITRGAYSYVDANGIVQSTSYVSDPINGFRAAATNLPVGPAAPVVHSVAPVVHAAPAVAIASEARLVDPVAIAAGAPLPTGDTVEVAAAKAAHFQAHAIAKSGHYLVKRSPGLLNAGYAGYAAPLAYAAAPVAYAPAHSYGYSAYASPLAYSGYSGYHGYASPYYG